MDSKRNENIDKNKFHRIRNRARYNIVRDTRLSQGVDSIQDLAIQIPRDINVRTVTVENSSRSPVKVAIINRHDDIQKVVNNGRYFTLSGGEVIPLDVNSQGMSGQYIVLLDYVTNGVVSEPHILKRDSNQFVLREGINGWFVHYFRRAMFSV